VAVASIVADRAPGGAADPRFDAPAGLFDHLRMSEDAKRCTLGVDSQYVDAAADVFSLLSDPTRIRIVLALRDTELPVNQLAEIVGKSPTAVSQHLSKLRWGRMVSTRQDGNRVHYRLTDEHARNLVAEAVFQAEHALEPQTAHQRAGVGPTPPHPHRPPSAPVGECPAP
jgi:DNA-binding transcriptional ArsR family regulator